MGSVSSGGPTILCPSSDYNGDACFHQKLNTFHALFIRK
jgi:hypothetical protein